MRTLGATRRATRCATLARAGGVVLYPPGSEILADPVSIEADPAWLEYHRQGPDGDAEHDGSR
jgi:hypothetical protein